MKIEIRLGDRLIAKPTELNMSRLATLNELREPQYIVWPGMLGLTLFHFKRLMMEPPVLFEHLSGVGLSAFLDRCDLVVKDTGDGKTSMHEGLRYVHGRSEVMRGNCAVSAVLLAKVDQASDYDELRFHTQLPDIYRAFTAQMNRSSVSMGCKVPDPACSLCGSADQEKA